MFINILIIVLTSSLIFFTPVFYGSVLVWSKHAIELMVLAILSIWFVNQLIQKNDIGVNIYKILPLAVFILLCFLQTINLPNIIHEHISHKSYELWDNSRTILSGLGQYYPEDKFSISVYPFSTISSLKLIFSIVIFGFFLSRYLTNKSRILTVIVTVVLISLLQAAIGFYQTFYVYGIYHHEGAHGTFVNHNHYSGLLELTVPLILGFAFSMNKTWCSDFKKIAGSIRHSDDVFKQIAVISVVIFMLIAVVLSKSRMGIFSLFVSLFFFYSYMNIFGKFYKNIIWFAAITLIFFVFLTIIIDLNPLLQEFKNIGANQRFDVWRDCYNIIKDFHLFGSGLGTFKYIYPLYKENLKAAVDYHYAHNDYIHMLVETGIIGFSCLMTALIILIKDSLSFLKYNAEIKNSYGFFITLGAFSAIISILVHSFADFNLHIPSNALYFSVMIGIIYGINSDNKKMQEILPELEKSK